MSETKLDTDLLCLVLHDWALSLVARYGHPVYLVGSALQTEDYFSLRDIDVVIVLPDDEFANRFGGDWLAVQGNAPGARWAAEVAKLAQYAGKHFRNMNFDIKVQSQTWADARHAGKPRRRIDSCDLT